MKRAGARFCSKRCSVTWQRANCVINYAEGSRGGQWVGDMAQYKTIHQRIKRARGVAAMCELRESVGCSSRKYEWSHVHETDPYNVENYRQLCKSCHITYDDQRGAGHSNAKLTMDQAEEIRIRYAAGGISQQRLADEYGVDQSNVSQIVLRKTYLVS